MAGVAYESDEAVLGVQVDLHAGRDEAAGEHRDADAEVRVQVLVELGRRAPRDPRPLRRQARDRLARLYDAQLLHATRR